MTARTSVDAEVLIIGAGPTGLATALFLAERGHRPRVVEQRERPSPFSKAFGVNARSLALLDSTGVTARFLGNGRRLEQLNIWRRERALASLRFGAVDHAYPFLCVQSQADSERLLAEALVERGVEVERGKELVDLTDSGRIIIASLATEAGTETIRAAVVLGADGSRSFVRRALDIPFDGASGDEPWRLYDLDLDLPIDADQAHVFLLDDGGMFVVRHSGRTWRVLGTGGDLLGSLPRGSIRGPIRWESAFRIDNRVAQRFSSGNVYLAGDAAHTHAGIGARGMNLGIEDAFVFASLYDRGELETYDRLRRPVVARVVAQIKRAMAVPTAQTTVGKLVRTFPLLVRAMVPLAHRFAAPWVLGLDHEVGID